MMPCQVSIASDRLRNGELDRIGGLALVIYNARNPEFQGDGGAKKLMGEDNRRVLRAGVCVLPELAARDDRCRPCAETR